MSRLWALLMVVGTAGCIVDDWRYQPIDAALADEDAAKPTDEDAVVAYDADVLATPDADVTVAPDADAADDAPDGLDADGADVPDADEAPPPDVPPPDIPPPPPGVVVRGGIAPSGAHVSATVRVRGSLTLGARHCNAVGTICVSGGISP